MSLFRHLYYQFKPCLPHGARLRFRRIFARHILKKSQDIWPICEAAGNPPAGWGGWPDNKQFALVFTHDVETAVGLANCRKLMELECSLGFRSSFNFIPEGGYQTPPDLREELVANGFEIGVHDLRHDGKLYRSKKRFDAAAHHINKYLHDWNAVGFRSGFMHHNLDWLHALDIRYDMSTFDTDPFEPQPDGVHTIFPFFVPAPSSVLGPPSSVLTRHSQSGYVEMPYTLPQDSTLFTVLEHKNIDLWKKKVDWIAQRGGMVLLNTHPDYIAFNGHERTAIFPSGLYVALLQYIQSNYKDCYWSALPKDVASWVRAIRHRANDQPETPKKIPELKA